MEVRGRERQPDCKVFRDGLRPDSRENVVLYVVTGQQRSYMSYRYAGSCWYHQGVGKPSMPGPVIHPSRSGDGWLNPPGVFGLFPLQFQAVCGFDGEINVDE